jgi:hypothetical protein
MPGAARGSRPAGEWLFRAVRRQFALEHIPMMVYLHHFHPV